MRAGHWGLWGLRIEEKWTGRRTKLIQTNLRIQGATCLGQSADPD